MSRKIAVFVGSLRKESFNRKMANVLITLAPESLLLEIIEIGGLPLYNQDYMMRASHLDGSHSGSTCDRSMATSS